MPEGTTKLILETDPTFNFDKMARSPLYRTCRILCHLFSMIIVRFWKLCMSACLILLLLYWFYGGALTFLFLMFSIYGKIWPTSGKSNYTLPFKRYYFNKSAFICIDTLQREIESLKSSIHVSKKNAPHVVLLMLLPALNNAYVHTYPLKEEKGSNSTWSMFLL